MSGKTIERVSVTATIEVGPCTAKVIVNRVDEESISFDLYRLQTAMMLSISKLLKEMLDAVASKIQGQGDEEASK